MKNKTLRAVVAPIGALAALLMVSGAQAALINNGGGLIYDSDQDITWLQNANFCRFGTDPFCAAAGVSANGTATWDIAVAWAESLEIGNNVDWRLPTGPLFDSTCASHDIGGTGLSGGLGCTGSELGYLFDVYGIVATEDSPDGTAAGPFIQVMGLVGGNQRFYWSGLDLPDGTNAARFRMTDGHTGFSDKSIVHHVWAVADGNITVPLPAALWLFGSGLGMLGWIRRRQTIG